MLNIKMARMRSRRTNEDRMRTSNMIGLLLVTSWSSARPEVGGKMVGLTVCLGVGNIYSAGTGAATFTLTEMKT